MTRGTLILILLCAAASAEIIDRVAVTLDNRVITESDILRQIRLSAFLDDKPPDTSAPARRAAALRLIDRALMDREMELSRYLLPTPKDAESLFAQVHQDRFPDDAAFRQALSRYRIQESELRAFLLAQLTILRFIDFRFRPSVQIRETEIQGYYREQFLPRSRARHITPDPTIESVHDSIEKILTDQAVDSVLDNWMKETRARMRIVYHEKAFQ
jgi:hypothetical protein